MDFTNHNKIAELEILENFILGNLPPDEEEAFEEHLLYCEVCRKEYKRLAGIIEETKLHEAKSVFTKDHQPEKNAVSL